MLHFVSSYLSSVWLGPSNTIRAASAFVAVESFSLFERYSLVEEAHEPLLHSCARRHYMFSCSLAPFASSESPHHISFVILRTVSKSF